MKQPRKARRRRRWLLAMLLLVVLATAGGWYYLNYYAVAKEPIEPTLQTTKVRTGDITITASGSGNLLPASELVLAFRSGGMLAEMLSQVGDKVEAEQILARLDPADAQAQVAQAEADLRLAELKLAELALEADAAAQASARASLASAQADLSKLLTPPTEGEVLAAEENLNSAREALALLQAGPDPEKVEIAKANLTLAEINLRIAQTAYDKVAPVTEKRDGSTVGAGESREAADLWQATTNYEKAKAEYAESLTGPTADDLAAARSKVALAQAQVDAQLAEADPDAVAAAKAKITQAHASLDALLAGASAGDLEAAEVSVNLARYSLENAQRQVENTLLRAPVAGTIVEVLAHAGEPVGSAPIFTLADLEEPLVRFWVEETDLLSVALGNPVKVIFEALPDYLFPGEITRVDPTLVTVDGTPAVQAWASVDLTAHPVSLLSGMTAEVEIISGEATDALLVPVQALRELAPGSYAVFVAKPDGDLEIRPVTVGLRDFANAEVLAGLERGENVSTGTVDTE